MVKIEKLKEYIRNKQNELDKTTNLFKYNLYTIIYGSFYHYALDSDNYLKLENQNLENLTEEFVELFSSNDYKEKFKNCNIELNKEKRLPMMIYVLSVLENKFSNSNSELDELKQKYENLSRGAYVVNKFQKRKIKKLGIWNKALLLFGIGAVSVAGYQTLNNNQNVDQELNNQIKQEVKVNSSSEINLNSKKTYENFSSDNLYIQQDNIVEKSIDSLGGNGNDDFNTFDNQVRDTLKIVIKIIYSSDTIPKVQKQEKNLKDIKDKVDKKNVEKQELNKKKELENAVNMSIEIAKKQQQQIENINKIDKQLELYSQQIDKTDLSKSLQSLKDLIQEEIVKINKLNNNNLKLKSQELIKKIDNKLNSKDNKI